MELTQENIARYLQAFVRHPNPHLATLEADAAERHVPIIGPWGGQMLAMFACSIRAQRMLELGAATGYSAIWLAAATAAWDGHVTTLDHDATRVREAQENVERAGLSTQVTVVHGTAIPTLQELATPFDLIFNDILYYLQDVYEAQQLLDACVHHLRPGGLLLCDNALRGGRVMDSALDAGTEATRAFTEALLQHPQVDAALVPIRDGLLVCRKHEAS
jgi:predicted O-methyltransferase YrrM